MGQKYKVIISIFIVISLFGSESFGQEEELRQKYDSFFQSWTRSMRNKANLFIHEFDDHALLHQWLAEDLLENCIVGHYETEKRGLMLGALAIEGSPAIRSNARKTMESIFMKPSILAPNIHLINALIVGNIMSALLEIGDKDALQLFILGADPNFWQEMAPPYEESTWDESALDSLYKTAILGIYFLQDKYKEARSEIRKMRTLIPSNIYEQETIEFIQFYDEKYRGRNGNNTDYFFTRLELSFVIGWENY